MKKNWWWIIPISVWLLVGIYGIYYNITYIDEAKYLIKGWLITSGQVGYYSTPEFFYQHMPGGLLWYGLGQKIFGPSLLVARIQSFLIGLLVLVFSYKLTKLINKKAAKTVLLVMSLAPVSILYYSAAVPQSLAALSLVLGGFFLYKDKFRLATIVFCLSFIIRENFLITLILYWGYLLLTLRKNYKELLINGLLSLGVLGIFFIPGWPGIINVLKNFPGVSNLLPISDREKAVLSLNWFEATYSLDNYLQAIKEFGAIYFSFLIVGLSALILGLKNKKIFTKDNRWNFLLIVLIINFLAHSWSALKLSPRAIIPYFAYIYPLAGVIIASIITKIKTKFYLLLLFLALVGINFSSIHQPLNRLNTISQLKTSTQALKPLVAHKNKIVWLAEPMSLYLAGKVSYYPLINHTNFYKLSLDTETVKGLGFWNLAMMAEWLKTTDLVVIDSNRLTLLNLTPETDALTLIIEERLKSQFRLIPTPENILPGTLNYYLPLGK